MKRKVLVVDVGGTQVKLLKSPRDHRGFASGPRMGPEKMIAELKDTVRGWKFEVVSIGFPAPVRKGRITKDPKHLAKGWAGFNFAKALAKPVRVINDAAMQALGSYHGGGRMLFLGLGTGLGSALVWEKGRSLPITSCWAAETPIVSIRCRKVLKEDRMRMHFSAGRVCGKPKGTRAN